MKYKNLEISIKPFIQQSISIAMIENVANEMKKNNQESFNEFYNSLEIEEKKYLGHMAKIHDTLHELLIKIK